mmetsp:Transcript_36473/g.102831  ORF Transcript_36473/g.102831 Transcript_36473/m.102831 type:complete len:245 (+) Transcript_36473:122-856(+)
MPPRPETLAPCPLLSHDGGGGGIRCCLILSAWDVAVSRACWRSSTCCCKPWYRWMLTLLPSPCSPPVAAPPTLDTACGRDCWSIRFSRCRSQSWRFSRSNSCSCSRSSFVRWSAGSPPPSGPAGPPLADAALASLSAARSLLVSPFSRWFSCRASSTSAMSSSSLLRCVGPLAPEPPLQPDRQLAHASWIRSQHSLTKVWPTSASVVWGGGALMTVAFPSAATPPPSLSAGCCISMWGGPCQPA